MGLLDSLTFKDETGQENGADNAQEFAQDPQPGQRPARRKAAARVAPAPRKPPMSTARMAKEVAEDIGTLIAGGAAVWGLQDDCCAPVLEEQAKPIADALTAILASNPRLLAALANSDIAVYTVKSLALGRALLPVGKAIYHNHIAKAPEGTDGPERGDLDQYPVYVPAVR